MYTNVDVLIVDDDENYQNLVREVLTEMGLHSISLYRGDIKEVLELINAQHPRIVILDVMMPGADGITLCNEIRRYFGPDQVRILVMSVKSYVADKERAFLNGADAFLDKRFIVDLLPERLKELLGRELIVRFWGVRGSIPAPGMDKAVYGGNTACVEVRVAGTGTVIFDLGSGARELGNYLLRRKEKLRCTIFISHPHWDHLQGLPFFTPIYITGNEFLICGAEQDGHSLDETILRQLDSVYFPVPREYLNAQLKFQPLVEGNYEFPSYKIETIYLFHPGTTLGYKLTFNGRSICYMTDNELTDNPEVLNRYVKFCEQTDLLIHDAQYTPKEYAEKHGWGHSTYEEVAYLAAKASVKKLVLFHHDPERKDSELTEIISKTREIIAKHSTQQIPECTAAQEGQEIHL